MDYFCKMLETLSFGDYISFGALFALVFYTISTYKLLNKNRQLTEYTIQPILGALLNKETTQTKIMIEIMNFSNTDAVGLILMQLLVNGKSVNFQDQAYEGKELWYFPARQGVQGYKEISGILKGLEVIADPKAKLELSVYLYYKAWCNKKKNLSKGSKYFSPIKRWQFDSNGERWIPILTSKTNLIPPEPDWSIFGK
ncbi:MAG: hypothetical protein ABIE07_11700 [Candidatus Zixiibacteriota bacterium]